MFEPAASSRSIKRSTSLYLIVALIGALLAQPASAAGAAPVANTDSYTVIRDQTLKVHDSETWTTAATVSLHASTAARDDAGTIYFASISYKLYALTATGTLTNWGSASRVSGVAVDQNGHLYSSTASSTQGVRRWHTATETLDTSWATNGLMGNESVAGTGNYDFDDTGGVDVDEQGNLYVVDKNNNRIQKYDPDGLYLSTIATNAGPVDVAIGPSGDLFVVYPYGDIEQYSSDGTFVKTVGTPSVSIAAGGIFVDPAGSVYVTSYSPNQVEKFPASGSSEVIATFPGTTGGGIVIDPNGEIYVTSSDYPNTGWLKVLGSGVLGNDTDAESDSLTVDSYDSTTTQGGTVSMTSDGAFTYTPPSGFVGADTFTYVATDGASNSAPATVNINVGALVPGAPTSLAGTAGNAQVALSWTAPASDGGAAITDYKVEYQPSGGSWATFADGTSTSTSATVTGLTNGTSYNFRVSATNSTGTSATSTTANATPIATVPGAPTSVTGTAGNALVALRWTAPASDGGAAITDYKIEYQPSGGSWATFADGTSTTASTTVTGLTNGTSYNLRVSATNSAGTSAASTTTSVTPVTTPGTPTGLAGSSGDAQVALSWTAPPSDGGAAITDYKVEYQPSGGSWTTFADGTTTSASATVTGLTNGTVYTFRVSATNSVGTSTASTTAAVTPEAPAPAGPALGGCPTGTTPFTDINGSFAEDDIVCLHALGITTGTSTDGYSPDAPATREQMASFLARLWRSMGRTCPTGTTPFTDINGSFAEGDIACIYALGITTGTSATTYSPKAEVTREQMAAFLARTWRALGSTFSPTAAPFTDINGSFAEYDIGCIRSVGITNGTSPTTYSPKAEVTREQMAALLARFIRAITA